MPRTTIRTEDIADSEVTTAKMQTDPTNASNLSSGSVPTAQLGNVDTTALETDIALLGFKVAANGSLAAYNLKDQVVDSFEDASGIDASTSTGETRSSSNYYFGGTSEAISLSATGGAGAVEATGGAGGTGTGGASQGTGGTGSNGTSAGGAANGGAGTNGGAGGGAGGSGVGQGGDGGAGDATTFSGGGGAGGSDMQGGSGGNTTGGTGYKAGGYGGNYSARDAQPGVGIGGNGSAYGAGDKGVTGGARKNNGGGGGAFGGGGGGAADAANDGSPSAGGGGGGSGGVVFVYTNSGTQTVTRFSGTSYTIPAGSTNLTVHAIGGGGGGSQNDNSVTVNAGGGGGGGGGHAKTAEIADGKAGLEITYTIGAGGAGTNTDGGTAGSGGTTSVNIPATTGDLALVSNSTTASSAPTTGDLVMTYTNGAGTATINTDLKAYISRDNGTTYTQATLSSQGTTGGHTILTAHNVDISSQPSGTSMRYKITTHNQSASKETRVQAVSLGWA